MCFFVGHWKIWQEGRVAYLDLLRKSSSCQMWSVESEDERKCYSFPSALIISEVCDIEQLFPFS